MAACFGEGRAKKVQIFLGVGGVSLCFGNKSLSSLIFSLYEASTQRPGERCPLVIWSGSWGRDSWIRIRVCAGSCLGLVGEEGSGSCRVFVSGPPGTGHPLTSGGHLLNRTGHGLTVYGHLRSEIGGVTFVCGLLTGSD